MHEFENSPTVSRAVVLGVGLYFALVIAATVLNSSLAALASTVMFGLLAIGIGILFAVSTQGPSLLLLGAATAFISGGLAKFAALALESPSFDTIGSVLVFVGVGFYAYLLWR